MHEYPFLYQQCESVIGYNDIIERLENPILLTILDNNYMMNRTTLLKENVALMKVYSELIDFLDGNGFIIKYVNNLIHIIPIERENI